MLINSNLPSVSKKLENEVITIKLRDSILKNKSQFRIIIFKIAEKYI